MLLGIPRYMFREILKRAIRFGCATLSRDGDTAFRERRRLQYLIGLAMEGRVSHKT